MERKEEVKSYTVRMYCKCNGEMIPTGEVLMSYPPKYPHLCNSCGVKQTFDRKYPYVSHE